MKSAGRHMTNPNETLGDAAMMVGPITTSDVLAEYLAVLAERRDSAAKRWCEVHMPTHGDAAAKIVAFALSQDLAA
jgi:hypothetical protein